MRCSFAVALVLTVCSCASKPVTAPTDQPPLPLTDCHWLGISSPATVTVGATATLSAYREFCRPNYFPLTNDQVEWTSLSPDVATVSRGVVTGLAPGAAVIDVAYGQITQQTLIIVGAGGTSPGTGTVLGLYGARSMTVGQRASFGAFTTSNGAVTRVTSAADWRSSNPAVLAVSGVAGTFLDRTFDAHAAGTVTITATHQGASAQMRVDVR